MGTQVGIHLELFPEPSPSRKALLCKVRGICSEVGLLPAKQGRRADGAFLRPVGRVQTALHLSGHLSWLPWPLLPWCAVRDFDVCLLWLQLSFP